MYQRTQSPRHFAILPILFGCVMMLGIMLAVALLSSKPTKAPKVAIEIESISAPSPKRPITEIPESKPAQVIEMPLTIDPPVNTPTIQLQPLNVQVSVEQPKNLMASTLVVTPSFEQALVEIQSVLNSNELDTSPAILPPFPSFNYPSELAKRGVKKGEVVVVIIIDEQGNAEVESIESATHPKLRAIATKIVKRARFSPPRYQGQLVKARYRWPLQLGAPS